MAVKSIIVKNNFGVNSHQYAFGGKSQWIYFNQRCVILHENFVECLQNSGHSAGLFYVREERECETACQIIRQTDEWVNSIANDFFR